jgi:hypothetical protein
VNRSANYTAQVHYSSKAKACSTKSGRLLSKDECRLFHEPAGEGFDIDEVVFVPIQDLFRPRIGVPANEFAWTNNTGAGLIGYVGTSCRPI